MNEGRDAISRADLGANLGTDESSSILEWDEDDVQAFLVSLGLPLLGDVVKEHSISGAVLVYADHEVLKEIGINSVGQRLAILKAVYNQRVNDAVPFEEGQWVPPSDEAEDTADAASPAAGASQVQEMLDMLGERDQRIQALEDEVRRLSTSLEGYRDELSAIARTVFSSAGSLSARGHSRSPTAPTFASVHPSSTWPNNSGHVTSPSLASLRGPSIRRPDSAEGLNAGAIELPKSAMESPLTSPRYPESAGDATERLRPGATAPLSGSLSVDATPVLRSHSSNGSINLPLGNLPQSGTNTSPSTPTPGTPTTMASAAAAQEVLLGRRASGGFADSAATLRGSDIEALRPSTASSVTLVDDTTSFTADTLRFGSSRPSTGNTDKAVDPFSPTSPKHAKGANPISSFKVTLEDPCYKVLPAAMRKYNINDDWRLYALFLCYGNKVERCLALDERPLLLFQKLKDSDMNPVFMLRHIKDIRSPISIAASKHASRRERRQREVDDKTITASATIAEAVAMSQGESSPARPLRESEVGPLSAPVGTVTFGVAVYPYFAERPDELHVQLRDAFEIQAKAKGWWRVRRHASSVAARSPVADTGSDSPDLLEGWVPSGCLVEVSRLSPPHVVPEDPKSIVHAPNSLLSQHVNGPALLDYKPRGDGELRVIKGEVLAVYKRYSSWSYVVRTNSRTCEGGWAPSWMVGRAVKGGGAPA